MAFIKTQHAAGKHCEWNVTDRLRPAHQRRLAGRRGHRRRRGGRHGDLPRPERPEHHCGGCRQGRGRVRRSLTKAERPHRLYKFS